MRRGSRVGVILLLALGVLAVPLKAQSSGGEEPPGRERGFRLGQNYPNPFNPETWIPFELPPEYFENGQKPVVTIKIYNILQQLQHPPAARRDSGRGESPGGEWGQGRSAGVPHAGSREGVLGRARPERQQGPIGRLHCPNGCERRKTHETNVRGEVAVPGTAPRSKTKRRAPDSSRSPALFVSSYPPARDAHPTPYRMRPQWSQRRMASFLWISCTTAVGMDMKQP